MTRKPPHSFHAEVARAEDTTRSTPRCRLFGHAWDHDASRYYSVYHCNRCGYVAQDHFDDGYLPRIKLWLLFRWHDVGDWARRKFHGFFPCPECGRRFGKHDTNVDHIPF